MKCRSKVFWCLLCCWLTFTFSKVWAFNYRGAEIEGYSWTKYHYRWSDDPDFPYTSDDDSDQDFYEYLSLEGNIPQKALSFSFYGRYAKDLDGTPTGSIYQDILEASGDDRERIDIYYAYLEKKDIFPKTDLRLGRMYVYSADIVHFDGLDITRQNFLFPWLNIEIFGGVIAQMYSNLSQDIVGGFNLFIRPSTDLLIEFNTVFYRENSYDLKGFWRINDQSKLRFEVSFDNDEARFFSIDWLNTIPKTGTIVNFNLYRRYRVSIEDDFLFDYTFSVGDGLKDDIRRFYLAQEKGYLEFTISVSQPIPHLEGVVAYIKYTDRNLVHHSEDEDYFNTDFRKISAGIALDNWIIQGFHANLGLSYWKEDRDTELYETESQSYYVDVKQELFNNLETNVGFYYKTEDINSMIEDESSTVIYAGLKYFLKKDKERWFEIRYEYNDDDYFDRFGVDSINGLILSFFTKF
ncbi:MAG: hypothetical protein GXO20_08145 [Thermodesulfobacteria bacterium]|nr:hypothetical protein [Thermodesulfobacteriota bacterium]